MAYASDAPASRSRTMSDDELVSILQAEERDASSYYDTELASAQAEAMDRYHAKPYGDELPNRSGVVTHDLEDTVNWILPALMRTFSASNELVSIEDDGVDAGDKRLHDAANYLLHVFYKDNHGELVLHDFCFDALVQKLGVVRLYWEDPEPRPWKVLEGLTAEQLQRYLSDPDYEIAEAEIVGDTGAAPEQPGSGQPPEAMPQAPQAPQPQFDADPGPQATFSVRLRYAPRVGRACVEAVPPEEFRIARRAKSIARADYHGWRSEMYLADLVRAHRDKAHELDPSGYASSLADGDLDNAGDPRLMARFPDEPGYGTRSVSSHESRRKVVCHIEYIRCDYDGDGVVELRRCKRVGNILLENDIVESSEFVAWSPIRVSHRLIGRSLADTLVDIQKIRTALTRRAMDSLSQSLLPRLTVSSRALGDDPAVLDRLLDADMGDVIPLDADDLGKAIAPIVTPDVSASAFAAIEYWDRRSEEASGVNRHAMGIQPKAITDTATGIEALQSAANARVEQVARWLSYGLSEVFERLAKLLAEHQDHARVVTVNGRRLSVDPRRWSDHMTVTVHVGMVAESREKKLLYLGTIAQKQEQLLLNAGLSNPLVTLAEYRNTLALMCETMGYRDTKRFFREVPEGWQPPQPGPDAKTTEVQGKLQLSQAELQGKMQLQQAELQSRHQLAQIDKQIAAQAAAAKAEIDKAIAELKLQGEREIAAMKLAGEQETARLRLAQERELAHLRMDMELMLSRERMAMEREMGKGANGSVSNFREGGRLDA